MTLPFRRRHNDAEATHDRARALSSRRLLETLDADSDAWLNRHLDACTECRREDDAFAADRALLRSLRDKPIEPPRDLWAKTAAALDAASAGRSPAPATRRPIWARVPLGAAAGVMVLLVVFGTVFLSGRNPSGPGPSEVAIVTLRPGATPITVQAARIPMLRPAANGAFQFVYTDVGAVCPRSRPECLPPPAEHETSSVNLLGVKPSTVTLSPNSNQVVYESEEGSTAGSKILIQPVTDTGEASQPPESPSDSSSPSESLAPSTPPGSAGPTPEATPSGQIEIASGVTIIGDAKYSKDGKWLAFSAAPKDGSAGPDLYIYPVGGSSATAVTTDHRTYFSGWLGSKVLASRIVVPAEAPQSPGNPKSSGEPAASGHNNGQGNGQGHATEGRPTSFLFDPVNGTSTDLAASDVWMPVVDPKGRFVAYWSGSLRSTDGVTWQLGDGQLVLDGWLESATPDATGAASDAPEGAAGTGPAGHPTPVVTSHVEDFVAKFDPEGIRLAVWVSENAKANDGRLHLVVIDPATGGLEKSAPLPG